MVSQKGNRICLRIAMHSCAILHFVNDAPIHTRIHTSIQTWIRASMYMWIRAPIQTCISFPIHTLIRAQIQTRCYLHQCARGSNLRFSLDSRLDSNPLHLDQSRSFGKINRQRWSVLKQSCPILVTPARLGDSRSSALRLHFTIHSKKHCRPGTTITSRTACNVVHRRVRIRFVPVYHTVSKFSISRKRKRLWE